MGEEKRFQEYLRTLPPELRAKILAERADEQSKKAIDGFDAAIAAACDAALSVAVVAYAEAKNDREREDAVRCTSIAITTLQQVKAVLGHVLPPGPKPKIMGLIVNGCAMGVTQYDQIVRNLLPQGAKRRARILEVGYEQVEREEAIAAAQATRDAAAAEFIPEGAAERARQALGIPADPLGETEGGGIVSAPIAPIVDITGAPISNEPTAPADAEGNHD